MSKTAHILRINHTSYAVTSATTAAKVIELLSKLQPVSFHYQEGDLDGAHYYPKDTGHFEVELKMHQPFRAKEKPLRLPQPKRGQRRCPCGHSDVTPGGECPSCGEPYPN